MTILFAVAVFLHLVVVAGVARRVTGGEPVRVVTREVSTGPWPECDGCHIQKLHLVS